MWQQVTEKHVEAKCTGGCSGKRVVALQDNLQKQLDMGAWE
jgi:hypothetical protein